MRQTGTCMWGYINKDDNNNKRIMIISTQCLLWATHCGKRWACSIPLNSHYIPTLWAPLFFIFRGCTMLKYPRSTTCLWLCRKGPGWPTRGSDVHLQARGIATTNAPAVGDPSPTNLLWLLPTITLALLLGREIVQTRVAGLQREASQT